MHIHANPHAHTHNFYVEIILQYSSNESIIDKMIKTEMIRDRALEAPIYKIEGGMRVHRREGQAKEAEEF